MSDDLVLDIQFRLAMAGALGARAEDVPGKQPSDLEKLADDVTTTSQVLTGAAAKIRRLAKQRRKARAAGTTNDTKN